MPSNKSLAVLAKQLNKDLWNLSHWLRANKLYLNVQETELITFRPNKLNLDTLFNFKPQGKWLIQTQLVKYLGVPLDKHLQWIKQLSHVKMSLIELLV